MIKFFRRIRQKLVAENRASKYLLYAIGEIVLVVIGILIALQINNWNENRKSATFQKSILMEMKVSLENDLGRTKGILAYRAIRKQKAISDLIQNLQSSVPVADTVLIKNLARSTMTLSFYYDKGAYESLKSKGLNTIENDELRKKMIRFYEVGLPLHIIFVDDYKQNKETLRNAYQDQIIDYVYDKQDSLWRVKPSLDFKSLQKNKTLKKLLNMEQEVAGNYINRLNNIVFMYNDMLKLVDKELNKK